MKAITLEHYDMFKKYLSNINEYSCENAFVNLLIWQKAYSNCFKIYDDCFLLYSKSEKGSLYRLPFCEDFVAGFNKIIQLNGNVLPNLWATDGRKFEIFKELYGDKYVIEEIRDAFDYLYKVEDLANLSGKKYHSKRNHISAFSKKHSWQYKSIYGDLIPDVLKCADKWYNENSEKFDKYMSVEREGIKVLLENKERLDVKGGAILVNDEVVAFTLASKINDETVDIHIEKALKDFSEAYTVINREFAKNELSEFVYINREDDMGLEGLRKAKLSYKPYTLIKKYICKPRGELCD